MPQHDQQPGVDPNANLSSAEPEAPDILEEPSSRDIWEASPLRGVKFGPMTAPGPSGCRPEHIQELLSVRKRSVANRLLRQLSKAIHLASEGRLPSTARWILRTSATFLEKPGKETPRPIRAGKWFRHAVAKALLKRHRGKIRKTVLGMGPYGTGLPGGCEIL